jgi:hypothetical protein
LPINPEPLEVYVVTVPMKLDLKNELMVMILNNTFQILYRLHECEQCIG